MLAEKLNAMKYVISGGICIILLSFIAVTIYDKINERSKRLMDILNISTMPKVQIVAYGEDVWTDVMYCYYVHIPSGNIASILSGRKWVCTTDKTTTTTAYIQPARELITISKYTYSDSSVNITVSVGQNNDAIIMYSSD